MLKKEKKPPQKSTHSQIRKAVEMKMKKPSAVWRMDLVTCFIDVCYENLCPAVKQLFNNSLPMMFALQRFTMLSCVNFLR